MCYGNSTGSLQRSGKKKKEDCNALIQRIDNLLDKKQKKTTAMKILHCCELIGHNYVYLADLKKYDRIRDEVDRKLCRELDIKIAKKPQKRFLVSRLQQFELNKLDEYSLYAVQILTHQLIMEEIKYQNLDGILRL